MAKNKLRMDGSEQSGKKVNAKANAKSKKNAKETAANVWKKIVKFFREIASELKKVEWPKMTKTKSNPGVLQNTAIVLVVVLFFLVVITAFDSGLLALLQLLRSAGTTVA